MAQKIYSTDGQKRPRKRIYTTERMIRIHMELGENKKMAINKVKFTLNSIQLTSNLKFA
jgi:hypothetical protein